jgi:hypothetical protein
MCSEAEIEEQDGELDQTEVDDVSNMVCIPTGSRTVENVSHESLCLLSGELLQHTLIRILHYSSATHRQWIGGKSLGARSEEELVVVADTQSPSTELVIPE